MLSKEIRAQLDKYGYTVDEFANKLGIKPITLYKVISRERRSLWIEQAIAKEIRKPINEVFPPKV